MTLRDFAIIAWAMNILLSLLVVGATAYHYKFSTPQQPSFQRPTGGGGSIGVPQVTSAADRPIIHSAMPTDRLLPTLPKVSEATPQAMLPPRAWGRHDYELVSPVYNPPDALPEVQFKCSNPSEQCSKRRFFCSSFST